MPSMNILIKAGCASADSCGGAVALDVGCAAGVEGACIASAGACWSSTIWLAGLWMDDAAPPIAAVRVRARASIASGWERLSIGSVICESGTREKGSPVGSTTVAATGTSL